MKILHKNKSGDWIETKEKSFKNEAELQDLVAKNTNILPLDEIYPEEQFVTIGKEVGLHGNSLDLLAVSPAGHIVVIETKLDKNREIRREVVGQILSYSASLWKKTYDDLEDILDEYCRSESLPNHGSISEYLNKQLPGTEINDEEFREGIEKRLDLGSFTLLIVVDVVSEPNRELIDIAGYLNDRTGQEIDFYVVEMEMIQDGSEEFLIPRLANPPRKSIASSGDKYDRTPMTEERFMDLLQSDRARHVAKELLETFRSNDSVVIAWVKNGFSIKTKKSPKPLVVKEGYNANFSFLFFHAGNEHLSSRIEFGFPNWHYIPESKSPIHKFITEYGDFYSSLNGYVDSKTSTWSDYIDDFKVFDKKTLDKFTELIDKTAKKLAEL